MGPRKVDGILDFIERFESMLSGWPRDQRAPMTEISKETLTPLPFVVEEVTSILSKAIEVHDPLTYRECDRALGLLRQKYRNEIERRKQRLEAVRLQAERSYQKTIERVSKLASTQNWYAAYRTLNYFAGMNDSKLTSETMLNICSECLRLGIKAEVNFQELASWLRKGIEITLSEPTLESIEDALDFIDAYGEYFMADKSGKGAQLISSLVFQLNPPAFSAGLSDKLKMITRELNVKEFETY